MNRPDVPIPVAGAIGGGSDGGGVGGSGSTGGAGGTMASEPPLGGRGGTAGPPSDAGSAGEQVAGQPSLFDELAGTDPSRNDVPGGEVCERIATIQCASEASCCAEPGRTFEDCKRTSEQGCVAELLDKIMTNPIVDYDRARAAVVFDEYERLSRQCDVSVAAWGASMDGFRALTRGTFAPGAACQPPAFELVAPGAVAAAHLLACTSPETHACLPTADRGWSCAPRAAEGGACFMDMNCNDGLFCTNSEARSIAGGTCGARKAEGAPCDFAEQCLSFVCEGGTCAPTTQQVIYCLR